MDEAEAGLILQRTVQSLRSLTYAGLVERYLDDVDAFEVSGDSGAEYQIEVEGMWDDPRLKGGNLRMFAAIDDGRGWRSISPMTASFIMAPDGSFVGE
jgi:hypothetical protein